MPSVLNLKFDIKVQPPAAVGIAWNDKSRPLPAVGEVIFNAGAFFAVESIDKFDPSLAVRTIRARPASLNDFKSASNLGSRVKSRRAVVRNTRKYLVENGVDPDPEIVRVLVKLSEDAMLSVAQECVTDMFNKAQAKMLKALKGRK